MRWVGSSRVRFSRIHFSMRSSHTPLAISEIHFLDPTCQVPQWGTWLGPPHQFLVSHSSQKMLLLNCTILENNQIFWVKKLPPHVLDKFKNQKSISGVSSPEKLFLFRQPGDLLYNTFICLLLCKSLFCVKTTEPEYGRLPLLNL